MRIVWRFRLEFHFYNSSGPHSVVMGMYDMPCTPAPDAFFSNYINGTSTGVCAPPPLLLSHKSPSHIPKLSFADTIPCRTRSTLFPSILPSQSGSTAPPASTAKTAWSASSILLPTLPSPTTPLLPGPSPLISLLLARWSVVLIRLCLLR